MASPLRIGMLGAARIGYFGLIKPAREIPQVEVTAVAARDGKRAEKYARKHHIAKHYSGYEPLLADPDIDAVYIPLPNGLHCEWTVAALRAGKHVLCEKPFANNAAEAKLMADTARSEQRVLLEAFHYRHHPMMQEICATMPRLGRIRHIEIAMCIPLPMPGDIRYNYELGGGASMDVGAYTANLLRRIAAASDDPALRAAPEVIRSQPLMARNNVDRAMWVDLKWANGCTARIENSLWSHKLLKVSARVDGEHGSLSAFNPIAPQLYNRLTTTIDDHKQSRRIPGKASYTYQLAAFADRVNGGVSLDEDLDDAVANMTLIDDIYRSASLPPRGS